MLAPREEQGRAELVSESEGRLSDDRLEGVKNLERQRRRTLRRRGSGMR
jgi:hypothetical protein